MRQRNSETGFDRTEGWRLGSVVSPPVASLVVNEPIPAEMAPPRLPGKVTQDYLGWHCFLEGKQFF